MIGFVVRRVAVALILLFVLSVITFVIYLKVPADPAGFLIDMQHATPAALARAHHELGTDRPAVVQYGHFVWRAVHGDFGISWQTIGFSFNGRAHGQAVGPMVWRAAGVTGSQILGGFVLLLLVAVPLGAFVATRPRSWVDRLSLGLSVAAISTHPLVVGLLLQLFVGNKWKLLPSAGYCTVGRPSAAAIQEWQRFAPTGTPEPCGGVGHWASHLVLPWLTFALFFVALYLRIVRARMLEVLEEPWVRTARAKGASEFRVVRAHTLRNAIAPVVTMTAMDAGMAIGIAMYIETVFVLPGLGRTMIRALAGFEGYDLPVILAVTLVAAAAIIVFNLVADLVLLAIDPTVARRGGRGVLRLVGRAAYRIRLVRILLVSQMYPGPDDPDLGSFVAQGERALRERGHEVELAVLDRRAGGKARYFELLRRVRRAGRPDVIWAHFLVPSGLFASKLDAPLVVTAHGRDVRNIGSIPGIAHLSRAVVTRASTVVAVSEYLRRELEERLPEARGKTVVLDSGVDLDRFRAVEPAERLESPAFVHVGSLTERKNVVRLADAFARVGRGSLTFVGDGPLRPELQGRAGVRVVGRVAHEEVPAWLSAADVVCGPALIEPFGQALLEAMACGRSVVATRIGGPPEFVSADSGVLVDPLDLEELARALETAASLPAPNEAARRAAAEHDVSRQVERLEEILQRAVRDRRA